MLKGYKTYIVSAMIAAFGALAAVDWTSFLASPKDGWALVASGVIMAVMRSFTTTPPGTATPSVR